MRTKLMAHMVAGYPDMLSSFEIGKTLIKCGVDYLEIQIPFSDPIADGVVIQQACQKSLSNGTNVKSCLALIAKLATLGTEIILMSYFNPILSYGPVKFFTECEAMGVTKFIIPDLPIEDKFYSEFEIFPVVSPLVSEELLKKIKVKSSTIYCTAGFGITGKTTSSAADLSTFLNSVKNITGKQVALGFGISSAAQVQELKSQADILIIGSQFIREYDKGGLDGLRSFATEIKKSL